MAHTEQSDLIDNSSFLSTILLPGSSLHPTFLLIVDVAFSVLLAVFIILIFVTSANYHIFALIGIELCLWGSLKWFVNELKKIPNDEVEESRKDDNTNSSKGKLE